MAREIFCTFFRYFYIDIKLISTLLVIVPKMIHTHVQANMEGDGDEKEGDTDSTNLHKREVSAANFSCSADSDQNEKFII